MMGLMFPKPQPSKLEKARSQRARAKAHRAVYAAVTERDGVCRICLSAWGLHRHHVVFRSQGGATTTANVVLLCDDCHAAVHAHRITLSGNADTGLVVR